MKVNAILVAHLSLFFICVPVLMQKAENKSRRDMLA